MALILNLETSTKNCSVAVSAGTEVLSVVEESSDQYIHSEKLHLFIEKALDESGRRISDLDAVAVGKGPGSYTGLRIGVSAAKGLCFALNIPLIAEDGLQILANDFLFKKTLASRELIIPMLDARRMEVYCAIHTPQGKRTEPITAKVIDENSFSQLEADRIHLIGDGAEKCRDVLETDRFIFHDLKYPSAASLAKGAFAKYQAKDFEDVAYFEPFYLKDFVAGRPKKLL